MVMIKHAIQEKHLVKHKINQENLQKVRNLYYFLLFSFLLFLFSFGEATGKHLRWIYCYKIRSQTFILQYF